MEEAWSILYYLPTSYKTKSEADYLDFLWNTFKTNYDAERFQFAFLAFHMLYMCFVYFKIWQIKTNQPEDFRKALVAFNIDVEKDLLSASSPFTFSKVPESNVFRFLKLVGCENDKIGCYIKMVRDRNDIAHSNGNIFFNSKKTIDKKIKEILELVEEIQKQSKPIIQKCFSDFLLGSNDPEKWEYIDIKDQLREILIHKNYLSQWDIDACLDVNIQTIAVEHTYKTLLNLSDTLMVEYFEISVGKGSGGNA
ncbi:MAG: hypothetical protein WAV89_08170 [Ignavibacteriaceae bacterium]